MLITTKHETSRFNIKPLTASLHVTLGFIVITQSERHSSGRKPRINCP